MLFECLGYIFIGFLGSMGIILLATLICIAGLYLIPGRKGYIEEEFTQTWYKISAEEASSILIENLQASGFQISDPGGDLIYGVRPKTTIDHRGFQLMTYETVRLYATARLTECLQDVQVQLKLKFGDYVLLDKTDTSYLRMLGDYLIARNMEKNSSPVIPKFHESWLVIFLSLFLGLLLSLSIMTPYWPKGLGCEKCVLHINGVLTILMALQISQLNSASNTYPELLKNFRYSWMFMTLPLISSLILYFHLQERHLVATIVYSLLAICPLEILNRLEESNQD